MFSAKGVLKVHTGDLLLCAGNKVGDPSVAESGGCMSRRPYESTMAQKHKVPCAPTLARKTSLRRSDRDWLRASRPGPVFFVSLCLGGYFLLCVSVSLC